MRQLQQESKKKKGFGTADSRAAQKHVAVAGFLSSFSFFPVGFSNDPKNRPILNKTKHKNSPAATLTSETTAPSRSSGTSTSTACPRSSRTRRATRTSAADRRGTTRTSPEAGVTPPTKGSRNLSRTRMRATAMCSSASCFLFVLLFFCSFDKAHSFFSHRNFKKKKKK